MRSGLYIAAAMIVAGLIANIVLGDPGYVALRFAGRLIEMSAVTFGLVLIASYFAVRLLIKLDHRAPLVESRSRGTTP